MSENPITHEAEDPTAWVAQKCLSSESTTPGDLLEELMASEDCVAFGPIHHFLVGASILTCYRNAEAAPDRNERLVADLAELKERSDCVPGAACSRWGVCGAAASAGMARAIICDAAPLKASGWSENQLMVARILERIAHTGAPRCCKRDSRIAVEEATASLNDELGLCLGIPSKLPVCSTMHKNSVCIGEVCPYHPDHGHDQQQIDDGSDKRAPERLA
jgi:hypothetical protein